MTSGRFVIRCWGWCYKCLERSTFNPVDELLDHTPHKDKCWLTSSSSCSSIRLFAAEFKSYDDAQTFLWMQESWWEEDEDGPWYWIEVEDVADTVLPSLPQTDQT